MTFKRDLVRARSHIIFILALLTAFGIAFTLENMDFENRVSPRKNIKDVVTLDLREQQPLSEQERAWAELAWKYFENNTIPETGMVNSVDNYTASTLWDSASYLMATISAYRLAIIKEDEFTHRVYKLLDSFAKLPLFENKLPNKSYNTKTLEMVDYNNNPTKKGIGWSAIDIGRVMVPLNILVWNYPQFTPQVKQLSQRWKLIDSVKDGDLYGATNEDGDTAYVQEGRLGYEEYAAKSYQLMGYDVANAIDYTAWMSFIDIYGINIPIDSRSPERFKAHNYVVSEPYILDGVEFGWDSISKEFAERVYRVQQARYEETGILTAVSEDNIDQAPYFVYNTVYTSGKIWNAITEDGTDASEFKSLSTKAAFGWYALFDNDYTDKLIETASTLNDPEKGWYSGLYEKTQKPNKAITANTNGIILEVLAYKQLGVLLKP
ncbi:MAG: DUF3131 domain-containing protein [bacterium]